MSSWVKVKLSVTDPAFDTPEARAWLDKVERQINEDPEVQRKIHGRWTELMNEFLTTGQVPEGVKGK